MEYYDDFTNNPLPHNATLHWTPIAAPFLLPWWTSVVGGVIGLGIAAHNFISIGRYRILYRPPPHGSEKWNLLSAPGRHFTLSLFGLIYTFVQTACGLLHIVLEANNLPNIQHVSGGGYINFLASLCTIQNPTIRTIPLLSLFAIINATLSLTHFTLLTFLPGIGTAPFWHISSNACIADVCDPTSDVSCTFKAGGPSVFGLLPSTLESATCVNANNTLTGWGHGYGGDAGTRIYTLFFVVAVAAALLIMITGEFYLFRKGDFTPTALPSTQHTTYHAVPHSSTDEEADKVAPAPEPVVLKVNPWFALTLYPIMFSFVVCIVLASITWYHTYNINHTTLQLIVTICPTVRDGVANVPKGDLAACKSVGFVHGMTVGVWEAIKAKGAAIFLRLVYNI